MSDLGVFEAMANAGKVSAEAAAKQGFEYEKNVDRAVFRARERFGAYLANSQSKSDFDERWSEVKPQVIKTIAEVMTPTPGVIRRVGAALRPQVQAQAPVKKNRPSSAAKPSAKTARAGQPWVKDPAESGALARDTKKALAADARVASVTKTAWVYDNGTKLWTSKDPMQKFACPGCGTKQDDIGFNHCAGCDRQWNSWAVRHVSMDGKTASSYVLMAREVNMRGDQFKLAAHSNISLTASVPVVVKVADMPMQPTPGTMPGDNSAAMGSPMAPSTPETAPAPPGDTDHDGDVAGGITEGSPIDQIQDALEGAVMALKDVQMLSINPVLAKTASVKVAALRSAMDRFWELHKQLQYVAGMLAKEANEAIKATDPRITAEAEFVAGFNAAAKRAPLPPPEKTGRAYLEGYVAFHNKQGDSYSDGADYDRIFEPAPDKDETNGTRNDGSFLSGTGLDDGRADTSDAGPFDTSQPAQQAAARQIDEDNAAGQNRAERGESSTIQPTSARRRSLPKARR